MPAWAEQTEPSALRAVPPRTAGLQQPAAVEAVDVIKAYGANLALDHVSFQVVAGKVNVILGENGAGKSTLMKILAGEEIPDAGRILCSGSEVRLRSPRDARQHGIGIIHQELSLFPALSVADNIFAGRERRRFGLIDGRRQLREADALLARLDERIDPQAIVGTLPVGKRQVVEIATALADDVRVLIMDEPTSALSDTEVRSLFRVIAELTGQGVGIVYISHRMDEIFQIGDLLTVLRDGRCVASAAAADVNMAWILESMLGARQQSAMREVEAARGHCPDVITGRNPVLQAEGLTLADAGGNRLCLDDVSFALHPGEILGIYGLLGAGKTELAETVAGFQPDAMGTVRIDGKVIGSGISQRMRAGIVLVPEDRQRDALVRTTSVADNVLLSSFGHVAKLGLISGRRATRTVEEMIGLLSIRLASEQQPVTSLSGGNQQKTIIARALLTRPKVLILDEPTRGIDVGAKAEVVQIMRQLADQGLAVLFSSSELAEVLAVSDRILVLSRGRVRGIYDGRNTTEAEIAGASAYAE